MRKLYKYHNSFANSYIVRLMKKQNAITTILTSKNRVNPISLRSLPYYSARNSIANDLQLPLNNSKIIDNKKDLQSALISSTTSAMGKQKIRVKKLNSKRVYFQNKEILFSKPIYNVRSRDITIKLFYFLNMTTESLRSPLLVLNSPDLNVSSGSGLGLRGSRHVLTEWRGTEEKGLKNKINKTVEFLSKFNRISLISSPINSITATPTSYFSRNALNDIGGTEDNKGLNKGIDHRQLNNRINPLDAPCAGGGNENKYGTFKIEKKKMIIQYVRLYYPFLESNILAQYVSLTTKKKRFARIFSKLVKKLPKVAVINKQPSPFLSHILDFIKSKNGALLPSYFSGVKVQLSGRIQTQRSIPRKTINRNYLGGYGIKSDFNKLSSFNQITASNRKGAYTVKI